MNLLKPLSKSYPMDFALSMRSMTSLDFRYLRRYKSSSGPKMPFLLLMEKDFQAGTVELAKPTTTIGRRRTNDIVLEDPYVSRNHAEVVRLEDGAFEIRDLGGKHPVRVNETLISRHRLQDGDTIQIGGSTLVFCQEKPQAAPRIEYLERSVPADEFAELVALDTRQTLSLRTGGMGAKDLAPLQMDHQRLMLLYQFANIVQSSLEDTSLLLDETLKAAFRTLDAERGVIGLVEESSGELGSLHLRDRSGEGSPEKIGVSRSIINKALKDGISVLTLDALEDGQFGEARSIQEYDIRSALCVPLLFKEKILGVIYLDSRASAGRFDQDDLVFLVSLSHLAGLALGNAILHRQVMQENVRLADALKPKFELIGTSEKMLQSINTIKKAAPTDITILIEGETGTGKELAAKAIHALSARSKKAFVAVNCAAIPKELIESELFGHEKGAFTGAVSAQAGKFEVADGGTVFLDEIGDMSLETQSKVLRVLEEKEIQRVGGQRTLPVDVRVIAATNKDLRKAVEEGKFREDLYYRLNVVSIKMPSLRDRKEDILALAEYFVAGRTKAISAKARQSLLSYAWPGNIRELKNCIDRAVVLGDGGVIRPEDLPAHIRGGGAALLARLESLEELEKSHIVRVLRATKWRKSEAARILNVTRQTLDNKLKKFKIKK